MTITYRSYSKILDKWFENTGTFKTIHDFHLYAIAMFSTNWEILKVDGGSA